MTQQEKDIVREFILYMACAVGTRGTPDDPDAVADDKREIELFNKLARIVGGVKEFR